MLEIKKKINLLRIVSFYKMMFGFQILKLFVEVFEFLFQFMDEAIGGVDGVFGVDDFLSNLFNNWPVVVEEFFIGVGGEINAVRRSHFC